MSALPTERNVGAGRAEHISLESDIIETRAKPNPSRPLKTYDLRKHGRGIAARIAILPDHYLLVETQSGRSSTIVYTVDLRFVDPRPVATRKVSRSSIYAGIG